MKTVLLLLVVSLALFGCGSGESMSKTEVQSFAPQKDKPRSPEAANQIADFKKRFEEKHGKGTNMPSQMSPPAAGNNAPAVGG